MKIDRLIGILMLLINKEKITAKQLAEHFEVSVRTIQRDIDTLTLAGIPLYADVGANGGYQLMADYKLTKSFLNNNEAQVLTSFINSLEQVAPTQEVKAIKNKFDALSQPIADDHKMIIQLNTGLNNERFHQIFTCLTNARDSQRKIAIKYLNIEYQETTRILCPYTLLLHSNAWYVYGYCELRNDFRLFKIYRIQSCELLDETFDKRPLPEILPWEDHLDKNRPSTEIKLWVDKKLQGKLPEYFDPKYMTIKEDGIYITLNFPLDEWLYALLMSMIPYVRILEPTFVREEFVKRINMAMNLNNYDTVLS